MSAPPNKQPKPKPDGVLTPKQEKFAQGVAEGKTQADAYRASFDSGNMKAETIQNAAYRLMQKGEVGARVEVLRRMATERHLMTVEDILKELEEARALAMTGDRPQVGAMVAATMGKAKVLGLANDKVIHGGDENNPIRHSVKVRFV